MATYNIAVLGAGHIGGTLGRKWAETGHKVAFGVNDPNGANAEAVRGELGEGANIGSVADALAAGDIVLVSVPGKVVDQTVADNTKALDGKLIIDAANKIGMGGPANSFGTYQSQTPNARVYRAFNTLGWENFANPVINGVQADLFFCGPDGEDRKTVEQLISDIGLRPIWLGGPEEVEQVDALLALWFNLAARRGYGRHLALKVLSE
jgi:8-hydroxy-5-deazaflavin:NADPH oxidoreductase